MPTCGGCQLHVGYGGAAGWYLLRLLRGANEPSEPVGNFCSAACLAAALYEREPWAST